MEDEILEETTEVETTDEVDNDTEEVKEVVVEEDYKKIAEEKAAKVEELEKKVKTLLIQKDKKDVKLQEAKSAASNTDVSGLQKTVELLQFQMAHNDLTPDDIKLVLKFRQGGKTLEETLEDADVKDILEFKKAKKDLDESMPDFINRSSVNSNKGMTNLETKLSDRLPIGYKLSNKK